MGVPKLRVWLQNNFPQHFHLAPKNNESYSKISKEAGMLIHEVEWLLIDSNPLIHSSAASILTPKNLLSDKPDAPKDLKSLAPMIYEAYWNEILTLINFVKPKKVYIAIDGVAPVAKQNQQRQRRYLSAKQTLESLGCESLEGMYSSSVITPGTMFMHDLGVFVDYKIRSYLSNSVVEEIVLSPSSHPGEGEHKILDYIRQTGSYDDKTVFYGPDGDLLILGMAIRSSNLVIMRDSLEDPFSYSFIEVSKIGEKLATKLTHEELAPIHSKERNLQIIDDFVLFASFVGNDFLPKLKMFMFLSDGLELMISKYKDEYGVTDEMTLVDENRNPITSYFEDFISSLADSEQTYIEEQLKIQPISEEYKDTLLTKHSPGGKLNWGSYRKAYYEKELGVEGDLEDKIHEMCVEYLDTFWWVFDYYTKGIQSWEQSYRYHEAPLLSDLANLLQTGYTPTYELSSLSKKVCSPFIQLMTVLPKSMSWLLPDEYRQYYQDSVNEENFVYDLEGKTDHYMGVVRLPFCDRKKVCDAYKKLTVKKYIRDTIKNSEVVYSLSDESYNYWCKWGALIGCKVQVC